MLRTTTSLAALLLLGSPSVAQDLGDGTEVRGRVVFPGGDPAVAVGVFLDIRRTDGSAPAEPQPLATRTDGRGWFKLKIEPPERALYTLTFQHDGYVDETWRWSRLAEGELFDLGEVEMRPAGSLRGRVLFRDGHPIVGGWSISTEPASGAVTSPGGARRVERRGHFEAVGSDDEFRIGGLPPGECRLTVDLDGAGRVPGPMVTVIPGEELEVDVVYDGPDLARRIHVELAVRPVYPAYPALHNVRLHGPEGLMLLPTPGDRARRSLDFDGLDPEATYTLEIDDPDFEPLVLPGLRPGNRRVSVTLYGSARLVLLVENGRTGDVMEDYDLFLVLGQDAFPADRDPWIGGSAGPGEGRRPEGLARAGRVLLKSSRSDPLVRGRLRGLVPGDHWLLIRAEGLAPTYVRLRNLEADEERVVRAELVEGGHLVGTVSHLVGEEERGRPGVRLALFAPGDERRPPLGRVVVSSLPPTSLGQGYERANGVSRADGEYELGPVAPGTYVFVLRTPDGRRRVHEGIEIRNGVREVLDVTLR